MHLVIIKWTDSHYVPGWHTGEPATKGVECKSVGWLIYDGKDAKTISSHLTLEDEPQRNGEITIPAQAIRSIRKLRKEL